MLEMNFLEAGSPLRTALKPLRPHLLSAAGFSFFVNILMIVPALYMLQVYDRAVGSRSLETLLMLTLIMLFLLSSMGALDWVRGQILVRAGARLDEILSPRVFNASFGEALDSSGQHASAQGLSDLAALRQFISGNALFAFMDAPWVPVYVLIMFLFHPAFGVLALLSVVALSALTYSNQRLTRDGSEEANRNGIASRSYTLQGLRNAEAVHAMGMLGNIRKHWQSINSQAVEQHAVTGDTGVMFSAISKTLRLCLQSLALGLGAWLTINQQISGGLMIAGAILLGRALAPIDQMIGAWKAAQTAVSQAERLDQLLRANPERTASLALPAPTGTLAVEQLSVIPPGSSTRALMGINFRLNAGTTLGVIGPSASGKSSLARALLGIWKPATGTVRLDGADVSQWNRQELGPHLGYLPQDIELFSGTVADNIARFGDASPDQVVAAATLAGVHDIILKLPEGYDTRVGPMGASLSGGQRQRIALARALFGQPSLVVLDEPNSNLDERGDLALEHALRQLNQAGTTVVIISHKARVLECTDKMLVLNDGRQAEFADTSAMLQKFRQPTPMKGGSP